MKDIEKQIDDIYIIVVIILYIAPYVIFYEHEYTILIGLGIDIGIFLFSILLLYITRRFFPINYIIVKKKYPDMDVRFCPRQIIRWGDYILESEAIGHLEYFRMTNGKLDCEYQTHDEAYEVIEEKIKEREKEKTQDKEPTEVIVSTFQ